MNEIKCPHCGEVFKVDASGYADIVKQVRDAEFAHDVHEREEIARREGTQALELERSQAAANLQKALAERDAQIERLKHEAASQLAEARAKGAAELTEQKGAAAAELARAVADRDAELAELRAKLEAAAGEREAARKQAAAEAHAAAQKDADEERAAAQQVAVELQREVDRLRAEAARNADAVKLAKAAAHDEAQQDLAARDAQIAELKAKLEAADGVREMALAQAAAEADRKAAAALSESERKAADGLAAAQRETEVLRSQLKIQQSEAAAHEAQAVAAAERERDEARAKLTSELAVRDSREEQAKAAHELELAQARRASEELIRYKDEEIERLKDMKVRLSTKMVGESLEQHCETEFNRLRMTAFPHAYFEKDNDASEGTKGDFIFRECDEAGNEIISIMFEMKNENDETVTKHKNEDFFKKLDHDRKQKGCEYAVLCTLLEPESDFYNAGIVDVSYRYEKMYVIRPQFFIPIITLLRNAALGSLRYKQELAECKQQNIDVTNFEAKMEKFKDGFSRNYNLASKQFESAIKEIDAAIKQLEKTKDDLRRSTENLRLAHNKAEDLTIRKLTWGNKTMKAAFDEAREASPKAGATDDAEMSEQSPAVADSYEIGEDGE